MHQTPHRTAVGARRCKVIPGDDFGTQNLLRRSEANKDRHVADANVSSGGIAKRATGQNRPSQQWQASSLAASESSEEATAAEV